VNQQAESKQKYGMSLADALRVIELVVTGKKPSLIKEAISKEFRGRDLQVEFNGGWWEEIAHQLANFFAGSLTNLDHWKQLAKQDRKAYQDQLNMELTLIKKLLNMHCGIEKHRPRKNQERDALIVSLKRANGGRSFIEVARKYNDAAKGKKITAGEAERIYKRQMNAELDELIRAMNPFLALRARGLKVSHGLRYEIEPGLPRIHNSPRKPTDSARELSQPKADIKVG
jgi:hypothetical protein